MKNKYDRPLSEKEFLMMQQEAIERAREMQKRSRFPIEYYTIPNHASFSEEKVDTEDSEAEKKEQTVHTAKQQKTKPQTSLFEALLSDKESLLILLVLYFLVKEQADQLLILALVYVLL